MTQQPTGFGRRGTPGASGGSPAASPADSGTPPPLGELLRHPRMLVVIPFTVAAMSLIGLGFATSLGLIKRPVISTASTVSDGPACRAKATAGSIFDIDWCQAAGAAVRGAATGAAMGAARR
jgi:hypothetical protein